VQLGVDLGAAGDQLEAVDVARIQPAPSMAMAPPSTW
jgi:hypothetical protein